jgi:hypothetical protein
VSATVPVLYGCATCGNTTLIDDVPRSQLIFPHGLELRAGRVVPDGEEVVEQAAAFEASEVALGARELRVHRGDELSVRRGDDRRGRRDDGLTT